MGKVFKLYDHDEDGKLNREEGSQYLTIWSEEEMGYSPGKEMIDDLFAELDDDKDGFIEKQDVFEHLKRDQETGGD